MLFESAKLTGVDPHAYVLLATRRAWRRGATVKPCGPLQGIGRGHRSDEPAVQGTPPTIL